MPRDSGEGEPRLVLGSVFMYLPNMRRDDLIDRLRSVEPQLRAHGVRSLFLFGSFARDEGDARSDVDVFVEPGTQEFYELAHFVGAYDVIKSAALGRELGYGTREGLSKYIRAEVEREAIRIF